MIDGTGMIDLSLLFYFFLHPPAQFLGDQRASYNQELKFKLRINDIGPRPSVEDVIIEGGGAKTTRISLSITDQKNPLPGYEVGGCGTTTISTTNVSQTHTYMEYFFFLTLQMQEYVFRLHENTEFGWSPRLSSKDFIAILANITGIHIRGTYVLSGVGFLDEIRLGSAERGGAGPPATWIERYFRYYQHPNRLSFQADFSPTWVPRYQRCVLNLFFTPHYEDPT